jgi:glucokinase
MAKDSGLEASAMALAEMAGAGDRAAQEILSTGGAALGTVLAGLVNALNPEIVVVGGNVLKSGDVYCSSLQRTFEERTMRVQREGVRLMFSTIEDAGLLGAAAIVFDRSAVQR